MRTYLMDGPKKNIKIWFTEKKMKCKTKLKLGKKHTAAIPEAILDKLLRNTLLLLECISS